MRLGDAAERFVEVGDAVAIERYRPAVEKERLAVIARHPKVGAHHVLVVALEKDELGATVALVLEQEFDYVARRRPAVDVIPYEDNRVAARRFYCAEQRVELVGASVDIPDGK